MLVTANKKLSKVVYYVTFAQYNKLKKHDRENAEQNLRTEGR